LSGKLLDKDDIVLNGQPDPSGQILLREIQATVGILLEKSLHQRTGFLFETGILAPIFQLVVEDGIDFAAVVVGSAR
jgi:hypothetical protein